MSNDGFKPMVGEQGPELVDGFRELRELKREARQQRPGKQGIMRGVPEAQEGGPFVLSARTAQFQEALSELSFLVQAVDVPAEFIDGIVNLCEAPNKLARIEPLPARAGEVGVTLEPSNLLLRLLAAARAGDFDSGIFEHR